MHPFNEFTVSDICLSMKNDEEAVLQEWKVFITRILVGGIENLASEDLFYITVIGELPAIFYLCLYPRIRLHDGEFTEIPIAPTILLLQRTVYKCGVSLTPCRKQDISIKLYGKVHRGESNEIIVHGH